MEAVLCLSDLRVSLALRYLGWVDCLALPALQARLGWAGENIGLS